MKKFLLFSLLLSSIFSGYAQLNRPKLVVGIVVDQMRWDYLYRYYDKYEEGGFKRMLGEGYSCGNTFINYLPSYTAVGHSSIYTGSVPAIHGISGNDWIYQNSGKKTYCTDDSTVTSVGAPGKAGKMSPRNLLASTITDELRLATNFQSKVIGVSLKDRASILPAGHNPTGAFWLDDNSGNFITSTYYSETLPGWVSQFNQEKHIQQLIANGWNTLLPIDQYTESTKDNAPWEGVLSGATTPTFPYDLKKAYAEDKSSLRSTPFGNTLTLTFAEAAVQGEQLGRGNSTDFLAINCASTDYSGHLVGPNAIEVEDVYLRLDRDLAKFFSFLDKKVGKGNYLVFLSADHGGAHAEKFMENYKMPTGFIKSLTKELNAALAKRFGASKLILSLTNDQVNFNHPLIEEKKINLELIKTATLQLLSKQDDVQFVMDATKPGEAGIPAKIKEMVINGYNRQRSGAIKIIYKPGMLSSHYKTGTTHGSWNPYDTHIPLIFMGWKIPHGETNQTVHMTDIASTLAALLHIQMPSGCIGDPITPLTDQVNK